MPQKPQDLVNHSCLQMVTPVFPTSQWQFSGPDGETTIKLGQATFQVNVAEAMAVAVREGMGVGLLPIYSAIRGLRSRELVPVLPEYKSQEMNVYAIYPSRQLLDAKIRTWVDLLRETLPTLLAGDQAEVLRFITT